MGGFGRSFRAQVLAGFGDPLFQRGHKVAVDGGACVLMESVGSHFLAVLRCPLTQLGLNEISLQQAAVLGLLESDLSGCSGALLRSDGLAIYPVRGGLPVLLAEELRAVDEARRC